MALDRIRQRFQIAPDEPDSTVMRTAFDRANAERAAKGKAPMPREVFISLARQVEGQAPGPPRTQQAQPAAPAARPAAAAPTPQNPAMRVLQGVGDFAKTAVTEAGKDIAAVPQAAIIDPIRQLGQIAQAAMQGRRAPPPDDAMKERQRRSDAFIAGLAAGGPASGLAGRFIVPALRGVATGSAVGGIDALVRSGGDPRQTAAGAALGGAVGGAGQGLMRLMRGRAPVSAAPTDVPASSPVPRAPLPEEVAKPGQIGTSRAELEAERIASGGGPKMPKLPPQPYGPPAPPPKVPLLAGFRGLHNAISPVGNRIAAQGPQGKAIRRLLEKSSAEGDIGAGKILDELEQVGVADPRGLLDMILGRRGGLSAEQDRLLSIARRGYLRPEQLDAETRRAYDFVTKYYTEVPGRANPEGLRVRTRSGKVREIPTDPRYHPKSIPSLRSITPNRWIKKPVRDRIIRDLVDTQRLPDEASATQYVDDWITFQRTRGSRGGDLVAQKMVDEGQAQSIEQAKGKLSRYLTRPRSSLAPNLERAREVDTGIFDPSVKQTLPRYAETAERRIAEARVLGPELEHVDREAGKIADPEARELVQTLVKRAREAGDKQDTAIEKLSLLGRRVGTTLLSPVTTAKNIGQVTNTLLRTDAPSTIRGLLASGTKEGRRFAMRSGATTPAALRQSVHGIHDTGGLVDAYLRGIGMTRSEKWLRTVAANAAKFYSQKHIQRALAGNKFSAAELEALGLDTAAMKAAGRGSEDDLLRAANRIAGETQFRARPMDLPEVMTAHPALKNMAQFKSFIVQQHQLIKRETTDRIIAGLKSGDRAQVLRGLRNVTILGTVYPMTGEGINNLIALITGKERTTEGLDRYFENLVTPAGAGIASDMLEAIKRGNVTEWVAGPSVGRWGKNASIMYRAGKRAVEGEDPEDWLTDAEKRNLIGQVPFVGRAAAHRMVPADE